MSRHFKMFTKYVFYQLSITHQHFLIVAYHQDQNRK